MIWFFIVFNLRLEPIHKKQTSFSLDKLQFNALGKELSGTIIKQGDSGFQQLRTGWNGLFDKFPTAVAQCNNSDDVARCIRFVKEHELEFSGRSGGHDYAGKSVCDGGLVIDLRRMHSVSVDPEARTATVGGGATMSDLDRATEPHGLATTGGRVSTTGVGGYALGGGDGWLARKMGLACDNLLSVELVTADGSLVTASEKEHPELFWALHGGGRNFGVATSLTFRLHELPKVTAMLLLWAAERGQSITRAYRDFLESAPDELGGGLVYLTGPPEEFVPESFVGKLTLGVLVVYAGPESEARDAAAPILELAPEGQLVVETSNAEVQCMLDDPPGYRNYWSVEYLDSFPDQAVSLFCARADDMIVPSPSQHVLIPQGGAVARGPAEYPIPWRSAPWCVHPFGLWEDPSDDERGRQWARSIRADLEPWASGAVYLNFIGDEGEDRVVAGFGRENYERLAKVKARYDPDNLFRLNHNIKPA